MPVYVEYKLRFYERREKEPADYFEYLNDTLQRRYLDELICKIAEIPRKDGDDARIAISLIQTIPYGTSPRFQGTGMRYPYEVIFDNCGICGEKSLLLGLLLRELGYGVALFEYVQDNHMTVGVKSPREYSYRETGYAFVESTGRSIVTDTELHYRKCSCWGITHEKLKGTPKIICVSDGRALDCYREFFDARDWNKYAPNADYFSDELRRRIAIRYGL